MMARLSPSLQSGLVQGFSVTIAASSHWHGHAPTEDRRVLPHVRRRTSEASTAFKVQIHKLVKF